MWAKLPKLHVPDNWRARHACLITIGGRLQRTVELLSRTGAPVWLRRLAEDSLLRGSAPLLEEPVAMTSDYWATAWVISESSDWSCFVFGEQRRAGWLPAG